MPLPRPHARVAPFPTLAALLALPALAAPVRAQSLLDRPPNLSGGWTGAVGTLHFHFVHRFAASEGPERKVSSVPTFLVAGGLPGRTMLGATYTTNSALATAYPNEWELFARWLPISQDHGAPLDVGGQFGYNNAARGMDAELTVARRLGRVRAIAAARALTDPVDPGAWRWALAGGATLRLGTHVALAADVASLAGRTYLDRGSPSEEIAWSAGLQLAIPASPHTFSLQASNAAATTLQGASRGVRDVRYGFEFTVPLTLRRYFGPRGAPPVSPAPVPPAVTAPAPAGTAVPASGDTLSVLRTTIKNVSYLAPRIEITTGTTVEWTNADPLAHTVTAVDRSFDSGLIEPGRTWRHTFTRAGTYDFFCTPHPFMKGVVVVRDEGGAP